MQAQSSANLPKANLAWLHPFTDIRALNRLVRFVAPLSSLDVTHARVVEVIAEGGAVHSLILQPNWRWRGHSAGQHCLLEVEIDGVRQRRAFSISSSPAQKNRLRLSVKRVRDGGVSDWVANCARPGDVVSISAASGDFVLPSPAPDRLLLLAAGSGITPVLAMLHQLADAQYQGDVLLLQCHRDAQDQLFTHEIQQLAKRLPGLRVLCHASGTRGRLTGDSLQQLVPDLAQRHLMMCGPSDLMADIETLYIANEWTGRLQREWFGRRPMPAAEHAPGLRDLHCTQSGQRIGVAAGETLLEAAERAGLKPAFGCRAGICRTCLCRKTSGQVRNHITGQLSAQPDEWIQLCISSAHTDIEVEL